MDTIITRRRALAVLGGAGLGAVVAACGGDSGTTTADTKATTSTAPSTSTSGAGTVASSLRDLFPDATSCSLTPEETEGPFYFDVDSLRRDIREDRPGQPLRLGIRVLDAQCAPISDAIADIWHCDAVGSYSGFESADDETFLRGTQATDADGIAEFLTVYPGWYEGRTVHIHGKVHLGGSSILTTQLFFDEQFTDSVFTGAPYSERGERSTRNEDDSIFDDGLLLTLSEEGEGSLGIITLVVQAS